jgi:uncharacterized membrane protein
MPGIARQEIGLLFFVVLAAAVLDERMPRRARVPLVVLFGAGLAVSHYTTTYLAAAFFGLAVVLQLVVSRFRNLPAVSAAMLAAFAISLGGGALWNGVITHSSSNVGGFTENIREHGFDFLPNRKAGAGILSSYLTGNVPTRISAASYEQSVAATYARVRPFVTPLAAAYDSRYRLQDAQVRTPPVRSQTAMVAAQKGQLAFAQLFNLLAVLGCLGLVLRRRGSPALRLAGLLGMSTLLVLAFLRLSGTAAGSYNQERAFLQTMVPLSVGMAWLLDRLGQRRRWLGAVVALVAIAGVALIFAGTSGLRAVALGGGSSTNLSNSGEDYERFIVTRPEIAAAQWLAQAPPGAQLYSDTYGQLRVLAATGRSRGLFLDPTPMTLDQHAWVYGNRANIVDGHARGGTLNDRYAIFRWPRQYLLDNYDTVYSNGVSEVYHR